MQQPGAMETGAGVKEESQVAGLVDTDMKPEIVAGLVQHEAINRDNFRDIVLMVAGEELSKHNHAWNYLDHHHGHNRDEFAQQLADHFPPLPGIMYHKSHKLPPPPEVLFLQLADLSWDAKSSTKPPPFRVTTMSLLDEFLTNTFLTSGDPLLLWQSADPGSSVAWAHYVKGACRSATALLLASLCMRYQWDIGNLSPPLQESLCSVCVQQATCGSDIASVALANARLSYRGSLRKPHCALTWLGKLCLLKSKGIAPSVILKEWNQSCPREAQIKGAKSTSLLALLNLEDEAISFLSQHVSEFGSGGSAFTETCWSNRKIMPGSGPKGYPKEWNSRLTMSSRGFLLMLKYIDVTHRKKLLGARSKLSNTQMEDAAMLVQLLVSLVNELEEQLPVTPHVIETEVIQLLMNGDMNLELQLQGALSEKQSNLSPADIPTLKAVMQKHVSGSEAKLHQIGQGATLIQPGQIERQEFDMAMASLKHDADVYRVWLTRSKDRDAAMYHQTLQWKLTRSSRAKEYASHFLARSSEHWRMEFGVLSSASQAQKLVFECMKHISRLEHVASDNILCICLLNWAAPNLFTSALQRDQAALMGGLCNSSTSSCIGVFVAPTFTFQRGKLYLTEKHCHELLSGSNLNLDHLCVLPFKGRNDDRERRSLVQMARVCQPMDEACAKQTSEAFRTSSLMRKPLLDEADLLLTKEMIQIEDMEETALPSSTDSATHASQAEKAQQLGVSAARSIVRACAQHENPAHSGRVAHLFIDLSPHTLDFARAVALERGNQPIFYLGLTRDVNEEEWSKCFMRDFLADGFLDGSLTLPSNMSLPPGEVPSDMHQAAPPLPNLHSFVLNKSQKMDGLPTLKTPDKVLAQWSEHPRFKTEFLEFLADVRSTLPVDLATDKNSSGKREHENPAPVPNNAKKPKLEVGIGSPGATPDCIPVDTLPTPLTWEADLHLAKGKGKASVVITLGSRIWLVNRSDKLVTLDKNTVVAGFYKGKWWHKKPTDSQEPASSDILFSLQDADSLVQIQARAHTLGACVQERRKVQPDCTVAYHDLVDSPLPNNPTFFKCKLNHSIYWGVLPIPAESKACTKDEDGKFSVPSHHLAGVVDTQRWDGWASKLVWSCKWATTAAKGLQPCRPMIILTRPVTMPAKTALELTSGASTGSAEPPEPAL